ncbi:MAG TPA: lipocalin family protein, partial [Anaerolineaceae bacterium]|nr:lipocalin family protein [Anaerolineaceae bacterium]
QKGPVLQGDEGYSLKGAEPGNASYYISQTRLETSGTVTVGGSDHAVRGASWMDHEYSTSALGPGLVGWDWFSIQLDDETELMLFTLRREDGEIDPFSSGTVISADGSTRPLDRDDFAVTVTATWRSPHSGAEYPAGWRIEIPSENLTLTVSPRLADQELNLSFVYWEGAVQVRGARDGQAVAGSGYIELTGYAESMQGQF